MTYQPFNPDLIPMPDDAAPRKPSGIMTVSQITGLIKQTLETHLPPTVHIVGEISNFKRHSSGHLYFTLKDSSAELSCVMWRSAAASMKFKPTDGMEVIATGGIEVFERAGRYQLYARKLEPRGVGALELAFRQLCEKLEKEGLFDQERKRSLPRFPQRIALVTSPTGAAVADMLRTIQRRFPAVDVLLYPVRVQGDGAAPEIAAAIRAINANNVALGGVDLMIVGRGGGSLEDLWAFNEEVTARAIFDSRIPVVSAVGHEVDVTIADLVADVRAATPTAAAELAVPVLSDVRATFGEWQWRITRATNHRIERGASRLDTVTHRAVFRDPMNLIRTRAQAVDELTNRLERATSDRMRITHRRLTALEAVIQRIAPHRHLMHRAIELRDAAFRLERAVARRVRLAATSAERIRARLDRASPAYALPRLSDKLSRMDESLAAAINHRVALNGEYVRRQRERLAAMGYTSILGRGFSITRIKRGKRVVRSIKEVRVSERVVTELADGAFESTVTDGNQMDLFDT
jgi:exodeoxyribonuclease VII large subunit